ncbi:hypothetical protein [Pollutimonas harenae]|uniref:Uncharacterized protein n=1 Tax=Pollutimonas harenae TaxID=657015 RepID=A0A853H1E5_9BURK|nr:hypothetical protein [Pollutimonas harenae]NYT86786.1 hypothetical protein [Pollutimonas harenae]
MKQIRAGSEETYAVSDKWDGEQTSDTHSSAVTRVKRARQDEHGRAQTHAI